MHDAPDPISINGAPIRLDPAGRICLTDLHTACGSAPDKAPGLWLSDPATLQLLEAFWRDNAGSSRPITSVEDGAGPAIYAIEALVLVYAIWAGPLWTFKVSRALEARAKAPTAGTRCAEAPQLLDLAGRVTALERGAHVARREQIRLTGAVESTSLRVQALHDMAKAHTCRSGNSAPQGHGDDHAAA
jgi:hypothetical protein